MLDAGNLARSTPLTDLLSFRILYRPVVLKTDEECASGEGLELTVQQATRQSVLRSLFVQHPRATRPAVPTPINELIPRNLDLFTETRNLPQPPVQIFDPYPFLVPLRFVMTFAAALSRRSYAVTWLFLLVILSCLSIAATTSRLLWPRDASIINLLTCILALAIIARPCIGGRQSDDDTRAYRGQYIRVGLLGLCVLTTSVVGFLQPRQSSNLIDMLSQRPEESQWVEVVQFLLLRLLSSPIGIPAIQDALWLPLEQHWVSAIRKKAMSHTMDLCAWYHDTHTLQSICEALQPVSQHESYCVYATIAAYGVCLLRDLTSSPKPIHHVRQRRADEFQVERDNVFLQATMVMLGQTDNENARFSNAIEATNAATKDDSKRVILSRIARDISSEAGLMACITLLLKRKNEGALADCIGKLYTHAAHRAVRINTGIDLHGTLTINRYNRTTSGGCIQLPPLVQQTISSQNGFGVRASRAKLPPCLPRASEEEVKEGCEEAGIHERIEGLPNGYQTLYNEETLWGEERRIAIARFCLYQDARIAVLDEPTNALDVGSEQEVIKSIIYRKKRTTVCITHHLSTITKADYIHVLSDGQIIESRTHEELVSRKGAIWKRVTEGVEASDHYVVPMEGPSPSPRRSWYRIIIRYSHIYQPMHAGPGSVAKNAGHPLLASRSAMELTQPSRHIVPMLIGTGKEEGKVLYACRVIRICVPAADAGAYSDNQDTMLGYLAIVIPNTIFHSLLRTRLNKPGLNLDETSRKESPIPITEPHINKSATGLQLPAGLSTAEERVSLTVPTMYNDRRFPDARDQGLLLKRPRSAPPFGVSQRCRRSDVRTSILLSAFDSILPITVPKYMALREWVPFRDLALQLRPERSPSKAKAKARLRPAHYRVCFETADSKGLANAWDALKVPWLLKLWDVAPWPMRLSRYLAIVERRTAIELYTAKPIRVALRTTKRRKRYERSDRNGRRET
ncbi:hypothetical protein CHU98_g11188 [Xylaria longipes]|nr:hypothetical protein CHU98_g11188 [Xylaria longipes]